MARCHSEGFQKCAGGAHSKKPSKYHRRLCYFVCSQKTADEKAHNIFSSAIYSFCCEKIIAYSLSPESPKIFRFPLEITVDICYNIA